MGLRVGRGLGSERRRANECGEHRAGGSDDDDDDDGTIFCKCYGGLRNANVIHTYTRYKQSCYCSTSSCVKLIALAGRGELPPSKYMLRHFIVPHERCCI